MFFKYLNEKDNNALYALIKVRKPNPYLIILAAGAGQNQID